MKVQGQIKTFEKSKKSLETRSNATEAKNQKRTVDGRSVFTFSRPNLQANRFREDDPEFRNNILRGNYKSLNYEFKDSVGGENANHAVAGPNDQKDDQNPAMTFKYFSKVMSLEAEYPSDIDKMIDHVVRKYKAMLRAKLSHWDQNSVSSGLESINVSADKHEMFSMSESEISDDCISGKRSITLFNRGNESLVTLSDGENSCRNKGLKRHKNALFNFVEM